MLDYLPDQMTTNLQSAVGASFAIIYTTGVTIWRKIFVLCIEDVVTFTPLAKFFSTNF